MFYTFFQNIFVYILCNAEQGPGPRLHDLKQSVGTKSYNQMLSYLLFDLSRAKSSKNELDMKTAIQLCSNTDFDTYFVSYKYSAVLQ